MDYGAIYEATAHMARVWAWRCGAETADEINDFIQTAWLLLLEASPPLVNARDGGAYVRRCILTAARNLARQRRHEPPTTHLGDALVAPEPSEPVEVAVWAAAELLTGWPTCTHRERLALVLGAAGWATAEIAATAPRLYPSPNIVAQAARRARRRLQDAMQDDDTLT